jgi:hypothetical protein
MNASAIYSKSGKGVQEAAGKTSLLSRPDRAVLSAIDGRATLADVAQKVGKTFDPAFEKLIGELDKGGFIREVSAGTAAPAPRPGAAAKPAAKAAPTAPMDAASDLDFTASLTPSKSAKPQPPPQTPPRATPPPAKHTATIPPPPPPLSAAEKVQAARSAKEQQDAFAKAREEAERKAQTERDRLKSEAEAKVRAETEAKLRAEAEAKAKAEAERKIAEEAEARIKAARDAAVRAAAEAKAKADAEAKRAREEAERARKEAEEKVERARKEAEEKARREQEELKRKLEEERRAREEAERKAKEEARRLEEERRKLEEERRRHEEEQRRAEEERAARRKREEEQERREAAERAERKKREQEEEERERAEKAMAKAKEKAREKAKEPEPAKAASGGGFSDSLLADLESFTSRDDQEQKEKEEAVRKEREEAAKRAREAEERRAKEDAERQEREARERRKKEEAERKAKEEAELREREEREKARLNEEEEKRRQEAEEREKKAKQEERLTAKATRGPEFSEDAELRKRRERALAAKPKSAAEARAERKGWGKPIAITLLVLLVVAVGVAHVMPIDTADYERAATDALGRPVKIASANLWLVTGLQLKFSGVAIGESTRIAEVRAFPEFDALLGPNKAFSRIEFDGVKLEQQALGEALFAKVKADNFSVARVVAKRLELVGPLAMPKGLEADVVYDAEGAVRFATLRGPEALLAKLTPKGSSIEIEMSAATFTLPFAPEISLSKFGMKGSASPQALSVTEWDGQLLNGTLSGTANVRWGDSWIVDGVVTARSINAAVFAPALLSEGRGEGSGKFLMRGEPGKLASTSRLDGSFTVTRGVLGSIDLSRAIQTGGKQATGRTQFTEMNGQAVYDRGAVALRNVTLNAGQLNAGASADIAQNGALSGRIVADVRVAAQTLRATLQLGGTLKEPQVRQ